MSESAASIFTILFVDDNRDFLEVAERTFGALSGGLWRVVTASEPATASGLLKEHSVDLIVLDVRMPEISGLQLMGVLQKELPDVPKVFLAGVVEEAERIAGLESGASLFLEKPTTAVGFQSVYATLNELLKWRQKRGSTTAARAGILDLVKLECSSGNSRIFEVFNAEVRGLIYIKDGSVVHAECPGRRGQSAFSHLATLLDGEFKLRQFTEPPERSVVRQWEFLYLEAVQLREQLAQAAEEARSKQRSAAASSDSATAETAERPKEEPLPTATESETATSPEAAGSGAEQVRVSDEEATRQLFRRPGPPTVPGAAAAPEPEAVAPPTSTQAAPAVQREVSISAEGRGAATEVAPGRAAPAAAPVPLPQLRMMEPGATVLGQVGRSAEVEVEAGTPPEIRELLVCTYSAEVLHEWHCEALENRLKLVELSRERSERLTQLLPLGPVDRLEAQATDGRMIIQFQEDGAILVCSATGSEPGPAGPGQFHQSMGGWLARHGQTRGLLAAGVLRPPQSPVTQSGSGDYPKEALVSVWQCVQELFETIPRHGLVPWQLRWIYEQAQLYVVRRDDGRALAMFLAKDPDLVDAEAVEKIFRDFRSLQAA